MNRYYIRRSDAHCLHELDKDIRGSRILHVRSTMEGNIAVYPLHHQ